MKFNLIELSGIYAIKNITNNKLYIGSTEDFKIRFRSHKNKLLTNSHFNTHLQASWNKYGEDNFEFLCIKEIKIEDFKNIEDFKKDLIKNEEYYIQFYKTNNNKYGYNARVFCDSNLGLKWPEQSKQKFSESKKGKPIPENTAIALRNYLDSVKGKPNEAAINYYKNLSEEDKIKLEKHLSECGKIAKINGDKRKEETGIYWTREGSISYKNKKGTKIYCYLLNGKFYKEFLTIADALKFLNMNPKNTSCITKILDKCVYQNFIWRSEFKESLNQEELEAFFMRTMLYSNNKKVAKYDLNFNLVKQYDTIKEAAEELGYAKSSSLKSYIDKNKPCKGYYYKYIEPFDRNIICKQEELLESPEVDNQQPSQPLTKLEGSETNS